MMSLCVNARVFAFSQAFFVEIRMDDSEIAGFPRV